MEPNNTVSGSIFEGYNTLLQAERAWILGNTLGVVCQLDAAGAALATLATL